MEPALRVMYPRANAGMDPAVVDAQLPVVWERLDQLEGMLGEPWAAGETFTLADCALAPTMSFASLMMRFLGREPPVAGRGKLGAWWQRVRARESVRVVLRAQRGALSAGLT